MSMNIKNEKEQKRTALLRACGFPKTTRAIIVSYLHDSTLESFLKDACGAIGVEIISPDQVGIEGADAFIAQDLHESLSLPFLVSHAVVPIIGQDFREKGTFQEFNPMKFEGNAFFFDSNNPFQIFASIVGFLENSRYPGDKKTLLKNVSETTTHLA